ncbi:MAG: single-stranded DNA-binding protein [Bacteroidetes bacterium 4572_77]|nr:MAG: single-stranded DNA-binding protein [Bacteroidetes bacterium 4572_77]
MKNLRNQCTLIGRLGANPEMKSFNNDSTHRGQFSLATTENYKNKAGEWINDTQWHQIVGWGTTAKYAEKYLQKGDEVMIQGKLTHRSYEDQNKITRYITEIIADQIMIINKYEKKSEEEAA